MFRTSDPLQSYSFDPRDSKKRTSFISSNNIQNSYHERPSAPSSTISIKLILIVLGIVIAGAIGLSSFRRQSDLDPTPQETATYPKTSQTYQKVIRPQTEYLSLSNLSSLANSREFESYMTERISAITRLTVDSEVSRSLGYYNEKVSYVENLKSKVDELLISRERLRKTIFEAGLVEENAKRLHSEYDRKIDEIEQLGNESISQMREIEKMKKSAARWEFELESINQKIALEEHEFMEKRLEFSRDLERTNKDIQAQLRESQLSEGDMERFIQEKEARIEEIKRVKEECQRTLDEKKELLSELRRRNQTLSDDLFQVELESKQRSLQIHSLETAQEIEQFIVQIRALQKSHAEKAKKEIDEVIVSLRNKEDNFVQSMRDEEGYSKKERERALKSLKGVIENEKKLLNHWIWEQFKTLRISREEIRNLTTYLTDLNKNIHNERGQLEALVERRKSLISEVKQLPPQFEEVKAAIYNCNVILEDSNRQFEKATREVYEQVQMMEAVRKLRQEMKEHQERFVEEEKEVGSLKERYEKEKGRILYLVSQTNLNVTRSEDNVRNLARRINELVDKEPSGEGVKRESQVYWDKVRLAEKTYLKIQELSAEIRELL